MALHQLLVDANFGTEFHACAFVLGPEEERDVVDPLVVGGVGRGRKTVFICDPRKRDENDARLRPSVASTDLLEVTTWNEMHLKGGSFDQNRMMKGLDDTIREHAASGRPPMCLIGQMDWIFTTPRGIEQLVEYESAVNEVLAKGKTPTVCIYDARRLGGGMVMDLLRAHPLAIMGGKLHQNPFYTPPDQMLHELRARTTAN
jgi:hypothetical protein